MRRTRIAALTAAGALVAAGSGVAVATTSSRTDDPEQREQALLSDAADRPDVKPAELRDALSDAQAARLDADVKAGRLTQAAADAIEKAREEAGTVLGPPGGPAVAHEVFPGPGGVHLSAPDEVLRVHGGGPLDAAAKALGISRADLFERLRDGKSLEDVAKAQGKSIDAVKAAIRADIRKDLDDAVDAGKLTAAEADRMAEKMTEGVDSFAAIKLPAPDHVQFAGPGKVVHAAGRGPLDAAAKALGITQAQLLERLHDGKSLEDVAEAEGKSIDDVKAAMRADVRKDLDAAVDAGKLTRAQADRMADKLTEGVDHFPDLEFPAPDGPPEPMLFGP